MDPNLCKYMFLPSTVVNKYIRLTPSRNMPPQNGFPKAKIDICIMVSFFCEDLSCTFDRSLAAWRPVPHYMISQPRSNNQREQVKPIQCLSGVAERGLCQRRVPLYTDKKLGFGKAFWGSQADRNFFVTHSKFLSSVNLMYLFTDIEGGEVDLHSLGIHIGQQFVLRQVNLISRLLRVKFALLIYF